MSTTDEETKALSEKVVIGVGLGLSAMLADLGHELGLYKALGSHEGAQTASELAKRTDLVERYVSDWLANQLAAGFVSLVRPFEDPPRFYLSEAQKRVFLQLEHPACQVAFLRFITGVGSNFVNRLPRDFREGKGLSYEENHPGIFQVRQLLRCKTPVERIINPLMRAFPAQLMERLTESASELQGTRSPLVVVDVACGKGFILQQLAQRYPSNLYIGLDNYTAFLDIAKVQSAEFGLRENNPLFASADAHSVPALRDIPGIDVLWAALCPSRPLPSKVDVFILTDALHDLADPLAALRSMRDQLAPESGVIVVHELGTKDPTLEALSAGEPMDLFLSAAVIGVCGPGAMVGRADGKPCSSASLGTVAPDAKYFELGQLAGFANTTKVAERLFRYSF